MYFYHIKRIILAGKTSLAFLAVESFRFPIVSILPRFPVALFPSYNDPAIMKPRVAYIPYFLRLTYIGRSQSGF